MKHSADIRRGRRSPGEKRDAVRVEHAVARIDYVVKELKENAETAARVDSSMLQHRTATSNFDYFALALESALAVLKRAVWRMAQRRANESIARWAERNAIDGTIKLDQLIAEIARRSAKLDETETEDERKEREQLDASIAAEERRTDHVLQPSRAERIQNLYSTRGMGRR